MILLDQDNSQDLVRLFEITSMEEKVLSEPSQYKYSSVFPNNYFRNDVDIPLTNTRSSEGHGNGRLHESSSLLEPSETSKSSMDYLSIGEINLLQYEASRS
jgi:hypothetical protein